MADKMQKLISQNPKVDRNALAHALKACKELETHGIKAEGYNLSMPYQKAVQGKIRSHVSNT